MGAGSLEQSAVESAAEDGSFGASRELMIAGIAEGVAMTVYIEGIFPMTLGDISESNVHQTLIERGDAASRRYLQVDYCPRVACLENTDVSFIDLIDIK